MLPSSGANLRRLLGTTVVASSSSSFYGQRCCGVLGISIPQQEPQQQLPQPQPHTPFSLRHYHGTAKTEIVPLILATVVVGGGYYSYRALQRMNTEWEDYHWALQEYERQQLKNTATATTNNLQLQSMAVDMGTVFTKLATTHPTLQLAISREGDRAFFNGVVYDNDNEDNNNNNKVVTCRGRTALERFYFAPPPQKSSSDHSSSSTSTITTPACPVTLPSLAVLSLLSADAAGNDTQWTQTQQLVTQVLQPAMTEVLDRTTTTTTAVRQVITVPSSFGDHVDRYQKVFAGVQFSDTASSSSFALVPEPVAAVWGAQFHDILPDHRATTTTGTTTSRHERPKKPTTLVVDVGGYTTQVAVVRDDRVVHATTIPFGGETVVEQLVEWLVRQQSPDNDTAQPHPLYQDTRALALLQMQARHAVVELSTQTRAHVHVPYVFANPQQHHLDARVARSVLEQTVQAHVIPSLVGSLIRDASEQSPPQLSPHLPIPHDFTSLWTSVVTQVLEQSALLPTALDHVLLVGGGSKMPWMQATVTQALQQILGSTVTTKLFPAIDPALRAELVVLGAATLLPSCDYSFDEGLVVVRAPSS